MIGELVTSLGGSDIWILLGTQLPENPLVNPAWGCVGN